MRDASPAGQPPRSPSRLKPEEGPDPGGGIVPVSEELLAEAAAAVASEAGWLSRGERDAARRAADSLARRMRDQEHINDLAMAGFAGPSWEIFAGELAAYGYPVILAWLRRGTIWGHCADRGRALHPTDAQREILENQFAERLDLALETTAEGLKFFRERVLLKGRWSFDGGASLTTYFVGACLLAFPNVYRRWRAAELKWNRALYAAELTSPEGRGPADQPGADPADVAVGRAAVLGELKEMPEGTGSAAALVIDGMSFAQAADQLGITERAVEGRLYRYRQRRTP